MASPLVLHIISPKIIINADGAYVIIIRRWLNPIKASALCTNLRTYLPWTVYTMSLFGKTFNVPRAMYLIRRNHFCL